MPALLVLLALAAAPPTDVVGPDTLRKPVRVRETRADAVLVWNTVALEAIRIDRTPPPLAARNLAMLHAAVADAVNTIYQTHRPYRVSLRAIEPIDPDTTVACTAHRILTRLYPRQVRLFDRQRDLSLAAVRTGTAKSRGITLGHYVADRILAWRRDADGATRTEPYVANPGIGIWQPTPPQYAPALLPHWGAVSLFGITDRKKFRPPPPPSLLSAAYTRDFNEVKDLGARTSHKRTAEQSIIAWFWDDGPGTSTPAGHWNRIAQEAALERGASLPENARLFALLNIALADAAIVCWDSKYHYRYWRPVAAIRAADRDGNPDTQVDARWMPLLQTPPFPSYTSGHSTFSGAGAAILARFFGTDRVAFRIGSEGMPGTARSFKSFSQAAHEAGRSRIYGGIHYECDNREGLACGKAIAEEVFRTRLLAEDSQGRGPSRLRPDVVRLKFLPESVHE